MKKTICILLVLIISIGILTVNNGTTEKLNNNTIELKVVNVSVDSHGKFIDFEDDTSYYIETTDGNLWMLTQKVEVGNTVVFDNMGTDMVYDDVIIDIK